MTASPDEPDERDRVVPRSDRLLGSLQLLHRDNTLALLDARRLLAAGRSTG